jgi:hypothetical protein
MSALQRLLAWLGAALWLRRRLVAAKARRLFGRSSAAGSGPGFHLAPADVPVEGVDYDVDELPPDLLARLEGTRSELLDHARERATRPTRRGGVRRRRTLSLATAAFATLAVGGGGAIALVTGSTGVPEVDRLLGIYEAELEERGVSDQSGSRGEEVQPRLDRETASIEIPVGDGAQRIVSSFYVARDGNVCSAVADRPQSERGWLGCAPPGPIAQRLVQSDGSVLTVTARADAVVVTGVVSNRVVEIEGQGPSGALDVRLGAPWRPGLASLEVLRPFVALAEAGPIAGGGGPDGTDGFGALDPRRYVLEAVTDRGERIRIAR